MPQEWGRKIPVKYIQKIFQIYSIRQRTWLNSKSCTQPFYQWIFHSPISRWRVPVINKKKKIYIYRCMLHHFWKNNNSFSIFFESSSTIFDRIFFFLFFIWRSNDDDFARINALRRIFSKRVSKDIVQTEVKRELCFLADYVSGGELFTHLYQREHFTEDEVRIYIGEVILALEHLHKVNSFFHSSSFTWNIAFLN